MLKTILPYPKIDIYYTNNMKKNLYIMAKYQTN